MVALVLSVVPEAVFLAGGNEAWRDIGRNRDHGMGSGVAKTASSGPHEGQRMVNISFANNLLQFARSPVAVSK